MVRLDHLLQSHVGRLPLKQAHRRILAEGLLVDGVLVREPKHQIVPGVETVTTAAGEPIVVDHSFCVLNKPAGVVSQRHPTERNVYDLIPPELRRPDLVAYGRLDRDTTGVLLFGTDGGVQSLLLFPTSRVWKTYTATLAGGAASLAPDAVAQFAAGMTLADGTACKPATLEVLLDADAVRVTLHEGFFHREPPAPPTARSRAQSPRRVIPSRHGCTHALTPPAPRMPTQRSSGCSHTSAAPWLRCTASASAASATRGWRRARCGR